MKRAARDAVPQALEYAALQRHATSPRWRASLSTPTNPPRGLAGFPRAIDYGPLAASLFVVATFKLPRALLRAFGLG